MNRMSLTAIGAVTAGLLASSAAFADTFVTTANGTWDLYPDLAPQSYQTQIQPPIAADGSSNFSAGRGTIPVQFALFNALGPVVFQSIGSDASTSNDYSYLAYTPNNQALTLGQLTSLSAEYAFQTGNCHDGALRWSVELTSGKHIFIYYGGDSQFWNDCTTPGQITNQSGLNMINANFDGLGGDTRYEDGDHGGVYVNYATALAYAGSDTITQIILVLDEGGGGDQVLSSLSNVNVTFGNLFSDTFVPPAGGLTPTCTLPTAAIQVVKTTGSDPGAVNDPLSVSAADTSGYFRVSSCKYMYNLAASSLRGAGAYTVSAVIGGNPPLLNPGRFSIK